MNRRLVAPFVLCLVAMLSAPRAPLQEQKPDESRFTPVVLVPGGELDEPLNFEVLPDGRAFIQERKGAVKLYDPAADTVKVVGTIEVNHTYTNAAGEQREAEEGLVGMTIDPDFEQNGWMYLLYAHPTVAKHVLSRFVVQDDTLVSGSETVVLEYTVQRETCCHTGGGMTWDRDGNLYITVGNNTGNVTASQTDQRPGRENWDDQRGAANTNDLRGKILRIHPEPDGSYTIPEGNLFPAGTPGTRPEIYAMGLRNAWRPSLDSRTGYLYWGEVGPDARADSADTVAGEDEFNQAREPGFFGWPYFIGANRGYPITDYVTGEIVPPKDPARPINDSRNNTGLKELPPAVPALVSYPYAASERFPELGSGGRCAVGGPVYRQADFPAATRPWPAYFEGKWLVTDCSRNWIVAVTLDENSDYVALERILTDYHPVEPIDMKFHSNGDLYVLEYGSVWFDKSPDSKLVRIEYNAGNRAPIASATTSATGGTVPFSVTLSAEGTHDPDGDELSYEWQLAPADAGPARTLTAANPSTSFDNEGVYTARLTVTDPSGASASQSLRIVAGNEPPHVEVDVASGNQSFFFPGRPIEYAVRVTDPEDGTVAPERVALSIDYVPEGFDLSTIAPADSAEDASTRFAVAQAILSTTDCQACHQLDVRSAGPSFHEIATRYDQDADAPPRLVRKIREGGSGVWGEINMPAHPGLSVAEASTLVRYILSVNGDMANTLPLEGNYTPEIPDEDSGRGSLVIRAVYTDSGAGALPAQTAQRTAVLRSPLLSAGFADVIHNATTSAEGRGAGPLTVEPKANGHIAFESIDLTGIRQLDLAAGVNTRAGQPGGTIEIRLDSPTGQLLGEAAVSALPPGERRRGRETPATPVEIAPVDGVHDVYFVFKNDDARPIDPLMSLQTIRFNP